MSQIIDIGSKILAVVGPIVAIIIKWIADNREKIEALILRVQKDAKDGFTNKEKEQLVVDLYFRELHHRLPWYVKILGKNFAENKVRKVVKWFTRESHLLKEKAQAAIENNK